MRKAFVMVSVMLVLLSAPMLLPSADAADVVGTELYHNDGTLYTEDDTMVNGRVESNYDRGTFIVPDQSRIPLDDSYVVIRVKTAGDISMQFTYTGAAQFLTQAGIKVCIHSDHERTQLVAEATATNGQEADFLKEGTLALLESDKNYYISMYTSGEARVNAIPEETGITFIFKATLDTDFHLVTFDSNGGTPSEIPDKYVAEGQPLGDLQSVSRSGYNFDGWYNGSTKVTSSTIMGTEDMHLKAHWTAVPTHTVTFDSNGGTPSSIPSRTIAEGDPIRELPAVTRSGYNLLGWHDGSTYVTKDTKMGTSDMKLTAKWEYIPGPGPGPGPGPVYKTFTLNYNANGGSGAPSAQTYYGSGSSHTFTVSDVKPTWDRRAFQGWSTSSTGSSDYHGGDSIVVTGTTTLYAIWSEPEEHTLYFDANGGTCDEPSRKLKEGDPYGMLPKAERDDYTFQGWFTSLSGGTKVSPATKMGDADVTIYAQWKFSGEEKEKHEERILPDGSVVEKDTIDRIYPDGRTEHIEDTVTTHPDSSVDHTYMRILAEKDGSFITKEDHSGSVDASGNVTSISYDLTDHLDDGTITISYDPSGSLDSIIQSESIGEDVMGTALDRLREGGEYLSSYGVEYDSTVAAEISSELKIESEALSLLAGEEYGLYIIAETGSMLLDDDVISSAASAMEDVTITMEKGTKDNLTPEQLRIVGDGFAVVVKMLRGSVEVHDIGGTATISLEPGLKESVFIYYIQEDGSHEIVESSYDQKTGEVRFVVDHFSVYLATAEDIDSKDKGFPWWIPLIIAIIVLAMLLAVIYHRRS